MKEEVLNIIKAKKITSIKELAIDQNISEATARRYLKKLDVAGYIELKRGGEFNLINQLEVSIDDTYKQKQITIRQSLCGQIAANKIKDGDTIFIDNGTTVRQILKYITAKDVKVYTNGIYHTLANRYLSNPINIIPGELMVKEASLVGDEAINYLSGLYLDKVFIGANGFDEDGVYTPHRREMVLKQFALRHGKEAYIVIDSSKQNLRSKYKICDYLQYKIITEKDI